MYQSLILQEVYYIPEKLDEGTLYYSKEFGTARHLCPCGCKHEVITPIGTGWWSIEIIDGKATLSPSIGNFQTPCKTHYWIKNGEIVWA